jgi:aryl-alcohol dehydrogenase-like predicted oxidoreductase
VDAQWIARHMGLNSFVCIQDEYSLLVRDIERELIPAAQSMGMGLLPFFPLASGLLTGKYQRTGPLPPGSRLTTTQRLADRYMTERNWPIVEKLEQFCAQRGRTMLELSFSWLAGQPLVSSVIAGATKPEQLEQNIEAVGWALTAEDRAEIDQITA